MRKCCTWHKQRVIFHLKQAALGFCLLLIALVILWFALAATDTLRFGLTVAFILCAMAAVLAPVEMQKRTKLPVALAPL